jgi:NAD(P)-dependent dehydrogenase (short-subunit alcohol dehydrogenase family)
MKTIVITGANSGIGYETAKHLALEGNTVIAASRKKESTLQAIKELNRLCADKGSKGKVVFFDLDLTSLKSVAYFAGRVKEQFSVIDTLICNAGIMNTPYRLTGDGFESQFQTNFLSHFYLTQLLIDTVLKSDNPKIISVCSASAEKGTIASVRDLAAISRVEESNYDAMRSYRESKLAQQVSVMHMSRQERYRKIKFSLIHPGIVNTNLFYRNSGAWYRIVMAPFVYLGYLFGFFQTPARGAQTSIYLAENDDYETGRYWHHRKQLTPNPISQDQKYSEELWDWTVEQLDKGGSSQHVA